jgi:hypothetical protein
MFGFGLPGPSFYHIHVPDKKLQKSKEEFRGNFLIKEGVTNMALLRGELKRYDDGTGRCCKLT